MSSTIQLQARAELERRRRERAAMPLLDFIPATAPSYEPLEKPLHLLEIVRRLEETEQGPTKTAVTCAPRHAKTDTVLKGAIWRMARNPRVRIAYLSYGFDIAAEKSRRAQDFARGARIALSSSVKNSRRWETAEGGCFFAGAVNGPLTGSGYDLIIVDDPHKNRAEAESSNQRKQVHEWFTSTAMTRLQPKGSVIVCHTRWHPDDLFGRIIQRPGWRAISLPALDEFGRARWPGQWPLEVLNDRRKDVGEYDWASLYMCAPRPRGGSVFDETFLYDPRTIDLRDGRIVIACDFAYTKSSSADFSVALVMLVRGDQIFVLDCRRKQVIAPKFGEEMVGLREHWKNAAWLTRIGGGGETGIVDLFNGEPYKIPLQSFPTQADKYTCAQRTAASWRAGKILLPKAVEEGDGPEGQGGPLPTWLRQGPWVEEFVAEILSFTGDDDHDDQVDALITGFEHGVGAASRIRAPSNQAHGRFAGSGRRGY